MRPAAVHSLNSTRLGPGSKGPSTASIYEAGTGGIVKVFDTFDANFIQIQGDGAFAIFWGDRRYERGLCAGITVKTYSLGLSEQVEAKWPAKPETAGGTEHLLRRQDQAPLSPCGPGRGADPAAVGLWEANYRVYGVRKLWKAARRTGIVIGRDQTASRPEKLRPWQDFLNEPLK